MNKLNQKTLSDGTSYPIIPSICECMKCGEILWNGNRFKLGHSTRIDNPMSHPEIRAKQCGDLNSSKRPEVRKKIGDSKRGKPATEATKQILKLAHTKICLLRPDGSKEIYPCIPIICGCGCNEICWGGAEYKHGHYRNRDNPPNKKNLWTDEQKEIARINSTKKLSDGTFYPSIPSLCRCGCNEVTWNGRKHIRGHQRRGKPSSEKGKHRRPETLELMKISGTKLCLYDEFGNKEIYPPIPITCQCKNIHCNEICYSGRDFVSGHNGYIDGRSYLPYCYKFDNKLRESVRLRDSHICQLCNKTQEQELIDLNKLLSVHHIHYDKANCYPDLITLCGSCNSKVNFNRSYYESFFMNILNDRQLLFWIYWKDM